MSVSVRFAPSPTGRLHVGNARTAIVNWLYAKAHDGRFIYRLDDTDTERSTEAFARGISEDLIWLGLQWDDHFKQTDRLANYDAAAEKLKASGRLYPAYETAEELELRRKLQLARRQPPVYDRAALKLSDADRAKLEAEGRRPHWRFKLEQRHTSWVDTVKGPIDIDAASLSDPVLIRADGRPLYTLSSVVDDGDTHVTDVIRGEDHITNTAVQLQLFEALGYAVPRFGHLALLTDAAGEGLSKRLGSLSLEDLRAEGIEPMAVVSLLARLGSADPVEPFARLADLLPGFDLGRFGKAAARFDHGELKHLNAKLLHHLPYAMVADRLPPQATERFWLAVRGNLSVLADAQDWWRVLNEPLDPPADIDRDFLAGALKLLPPGPYDETSWKPWIDAVKTATGRKGKELFLPIRRALTGRDHGPEMHYLLPLLGEEQVRSRLLAAGGA